MLLNNLLDTRATSVTIGHPRDPAVAELLGLPDVTAGVQVNERTALTFSPVWAAIHVIADPIGFLPFPVYRRLSPRGKERARDHPVYRLLNHRANPDMSSQDLRETLEAHKLSWGNGYAKIEWDNQGRPIALWPRRPDRMKVERIGGQLVYTYTFDTGTPEISPAGDMIHVHGLGFDGVYGYSVIGMARESIGLGMATELFGASFFGHGARPCGLLSYPGEVTPEMRNNIERSIAEKRAGLGNAQRAWVLEEDIKWTPLGIPPEDAQFLQTREFQVPEIARWFQIPPHRIASMKGAIKANIESEALDFVRYSLGRHTRTWEHEINFKLLGGAKNEGLFAEFLFDALLRGDSAARHQAYAAGRQWGYYSPNDVLAMENKNPIKGKGGDDYHMPLNMIPISGVAQPPEPKTTEPQNRNPETRQLLETRASVQQNRGIQQRVGIARSHQVLFVDAAQRFVGKEIKSVGVAAKRFLKDPANPVGLLEWLETFYEDHRGAVRNGMRGPVDVLGDSIYRAVVDEVGGEAELPESVRKFLGEYVDAAAIRHTESGHGQMRAIVSQAPSDDPEGLRTAVDTRLEEWGETRAAKIGSREVAQAASAIAVVAFAASGREKLIWAAYGSDTCPICQDMADRVVGLGQPFAAQGEKFGSGTQTFTAGHSVTHPPIHDG